MKKEHWIMIHYKLTFFYYFYDNRSYSWFLNLLRSFRITFEGPFTVLVYSVCPSRPLSRTLPRTFSLNLSFTIPIKDFTKDLYTHFVLHNRYQGLYHSSPHSICPLRPLSRTFLTDLYSRFALHNLYQGLYQGHFHSICPSQSLSRTLPKIFILILSFTPLRNTFKSQKFSLFGLLLFLFYMLIL